MGNVDGAARLSRAVVQPRVDCIKLQNIYEGQIPKVGIISYSTSSNLIVSTSRSIST